MYQSPLPWKTGPVNDCHMHTFNKVGREHWDNIMHMTGTNRATLLCLPGHWKDEMVPESLSLKADYPDRYFVFGGVVHAHTAEGPVPSLADQVKAYHDAGFDGIKMLEGKPSTRAGFCPYRLDDPYYAEFFEAIQELDMPVTLHVADPAYFWENNNDLSKDFPSQESYFEEAYNVFERYPGIRFTLAHFFFMSHDLKRAADLFDRHPQLTVDLSLGNVLLYYLSHGGETAREFLIKYADRILYGTDINEHNNINLAVSKADALRQLLETDETVVPLLHKDNPLPIFGGNPEIKGLDLPVETLNKIYRDNHVRVCGESPRPLSVSV